jgi:hypothetical protein
VLHDPSHYEPPAPAEPILLEDSEKTVLRRLAEEVAAIAADPSHRWKAELWRRLNDRESVRPMVWINEIPWHEMDVDGELTLLTCHPWARSQERDLRRLIYQWRHMPGDMIVSDFLACPLAVHSTDFGILEEVDVVRTDAESDIVSRHFHKQIHDFADLDKIRMPEVTHDRQATEYSYAAMCELYGDIMPVRKVGQTHIWFTPWDYLVRWWGIEEAMVDMYERPDLVHAAVERMVDAWIVELDQFVDQNLLSLDCDNTRIGSGGYGYTSTLPGDDFDPGYVRPHNMWGCSNAQIFSEVSPRFHWEFALEHDLRWLLRAAGRQGGPVEADSPAAQGVGHPVVQDRACGGGDRAALGHQPQAQPGDFCRGPVESRPCPAGSPRLPRSGPRLPRGTDHEGHFHGSPPAGAALGLGPHRLGSRGGVRIVTTGVNRFAATPMDAAWATTA